MKPLFHPVLVNDPIGDPGVYVDCLFEKRALLFDLGDISRLAAYTWNLVESYDTDFTLDVLEMFPDAPARRASFRCRAAFRREGEEEVVVADGVLLDEETFLIRGVTLDHKTPCLAFALEEKQHLNVWKNRLEEMGLPTGPWLKELKRAVLRGEPDARPFAVRWCDREGAHERVYPLGELKREVLRIVPGQKIAYELTQR